mmetsp:Transcript_8364/g.15133  ORF Transcript_8364/g.15133 Transcript_8364/m.15133 type:complete len:342 (+) Transcript_8364:77-1102(+)
MEGSFNSDKGTSAKLLQEEYVQSRIDKMNESVESDDEDFFNDPDEVSYTPEETKNWKLIMIIAAIGWILWIAFYVPFMVYLVRPDGLSVDSWTYSGFSTNPQFWSLIAPDFASCNTTIPMQSPINIEINSTFTPPDAELRAGIDSFANHLTGTFSFQVDHETATYTCTTKKGCGSIDWQGEQFYLNYMTLHQIAQHSISGVLLPMELSMIHVAETGDKTEGFGEKYAVLNVLYTENDVVNNTALNPLWWDTMTDPGAVIDNVQINALYNPASSYYVYEGSLSFPPCTPSTMQFVQAQLELASFDQINFLRRTVTTYPGNRRQTQPTGSRSVLFYPRNNLLS